MKKIRIYRDDFPRNIDPEKYVKKILKQEGFDLYREIKQVDDLIRRYVEYSQEDLKLKDKEGKCTT